VSEKASDSSSKVWKGIGRSHEELKGMSIDSKRRRIWWVWKRVGRLWACG